MLVRRHRKWLIPSIVGVALVALLAAGWLWAQQFQQAASTAKRAASSGVKALTSLDLTTAGPQFALAEQEFGRARSLLGPDWLQGVPWLGTQFAAAAELTEIGGTAASAGGQLTDLLVQTTAGSAGDRFGTLAGLSASHLEPALSKLAEVDRRTAALSADGLVPPLADAVGELKRLIEPYQGVLAQADNARQLAHYLFGSQHRFILLSQNNAELRPLGGFPGTYGLASIGPDGFRLEKYAGIHRLPTDTLNLPAPEGALMNAKLRFRDANWWIDFPTSAPVMLKFWDNLGQPPVDGVIAIDVVTLQDLLTVFGPVTLPGTSEQLTKDNAVRRLTEFIEFDRASYGKRAKAEALIPLVESMLKRIENVQIDQLTPLLTTFNKLTAQKHIQFYATDAPAEAAFVALGVAGAIAPPPNTTDLLVVSNAMVRASKSNLGVSKYLDYQVTLVADGSATTQLSLGFRKTAETYPGLPTQLFCDYLRVYRAPGTTATASTSDGFVDRPEDGRPVFAKYFELAPGQLLSQQLHTTVPQALALAADQRTAHYRLLLVRQADLAATTVNLSVTAPQGWQFSSGQAGWRPEGGNPMTVQLSGSTASLHGPLDRDLIVDLELTKA